MALRFTWSRIGSVSATVSIIDHFAGVEDPRMERAGQRKLENIIAIAVRAVIAGADGWVDIESFGRAKLDRFETFIELPNGIPSHYTFGRVFSIIDAKLFQDASPNEQSRSGKPRKDKSSR